MRLLYTAWDGSQQVRLDADRIFDSLADHIARSQNLVEALDSLLREGIDGEQFQLVGLDDLVAEAREAIDELLTTWNLDHALEAHQRRLDDLLDEEQEALEEAADAEGGVDGEEAEGRASTRRHRFASFPRELEAALALLGKWDFASPASAAEADDLLEEADEVGAVARFRRRWGEKFVGPRAADFEEARALMETLEALRRLEDALAGGNFDAIDGAEVESLLGPDVADALALLRDVVATLDGAGYVVRKGEHMSLSARGAQRLGQVALREILSNIVFDGAGRHETRREGSAEAVAEARKRYEFGDPMTLDVGATVRNAVLRGGPAGQGGHAAGVRLDAADFEVLQRRRDTRTSTVVLLDMSWSMSWEGRFAAAKKVVLAMDALMRTRYPHDDFAVVGFYTRAIELDPRALPEVSWNMGDPFTNLQDGLRLGAELLGRRAAANQQMIIITDGQPTAYYSKGRLFCEWPMGIGGLSTRATIETLREVGRVTRRGIRINTFMLDNSPPLRAFVEKMTAINKGRAFYTTPERLGHFLLVDYVGRRRKVV
jgi:uncharacterized protein with von Willebrand factor type A (vWA) domain